MSDSIRLRGGKPLEGEIELRGAKNAVFKQMIAALLTDEQCILDDISVVEDVHITGQLMSRMGSNYQLEGNRLTIQASSLRSLGARKIADLGGKSRAPILFCGPLLVRLGEAVIPKLGGCDIGPRPINFHISALQKLGATFVEKRDGYYLRAEKLRGTKIRLDYPSVMATEQVLLSSVLAEGVTELSNAAVEPEIIDLITVLQKMGAIISVNTDRIITITGVKKLRGFSHRSIPDRNEAVSWACAALATNGRITVKNARQLDLLTFLNKYRQIGGEFDADDNGITFYRGQNGLRSISLETDVHPGFMTDWQQPFVVALTQAEGASIVHETVYENRFGYVEALNRMGARIQLYQECLGSVHCRFESMNYLHSAVITGPTKLTGAEITVPDLRAGFSYVVAALAAEGESVIHNYSVIGRGYEDFSNKLRNLGAEILEVTT